MDTWTMRTLTHVPLVSVLIWFDGMLKQTCLYENQYVSYRLTLLSDFAQIISSSLPRPASQDPPLGEIIQKFNVTEIRFDTKKQ